MPHTPEVVEEFERRFPALASQLGARNTGILVNSTTLLELPAGRKIIRDRMPVDSLYLLLKGEVAITVEEGGKSIQLGIVGPGQWLGEVSVLSGELLASSTVTSATPVKMMRLRHEKFDDLIASNHDVASALLRQLVGMLADRLRTSVQSFGAVTAVNAADAESAPADFDPTRTEGRNWIRSFFRKATGT